MRPARPTPNFSSNIRRRRMRSVSASPLNRQVPAAEAAGAIAEGELDAIFAAVETAKRVALAVSGGADSLALLVCFDRWRQKRGRPDGVVLTVDHRLREGSGEEAAAVARAAVARGLAARVLVW